MSAASTEPAELELGHYGAVRLKLAPTVRLEPDVKARLVLDKLQEANFEISGAATNLIEPIPCSLEWLIHTDVVGHDQNADKGLLVPHPRPTVVVPKAGGFALKEWDEKTKSPVPLALNALELRLLGHGKLGYVLTLDIIGAPPVHCEVPGASKLHTECKGHHLVLLPSKSNITVNLPVPVKLEQLSKLKSFDVVDVGQQFQVSWDTMAWAQEDHIKVELEVAQYVDQHSDAGPPTRASVRGSEILLELHRASPSAKTSCRFMLGTNTFYDEDWGQFELRYHLAGAAAQTHYAWRIAVTRVAESLSRGAKPKPPPPVQQAWTEPRFFATNIAKPTLATLQIGAASVWKSLLTRDSDLAVEGLFKGFDAALDFPVVVEVYGITAHKPGGSGGSSEPNLSQPLLSPLMDPLPPLGPLLQSGTSTANDPAIYPINKLLPFSSNPPPSSIPLSVSQGKFSGVVFELSKYKTRLKKFHPDLTIFAALRFHPGLFGEAVHIPFMDCARYTPNTLLSSKPEGFAPFDAGAFAHEASASAVCTDQVDLTGNLRDLVGTSALPFAPNASAVKSFTTSVGGPVTVGTGKQAKPTGEGRTHAAYRHLMSQKFADELESGVAPNGKSLSASQKSMLQKISETYGFSDRFALYRAVETITRVSWEIVAILHLIESNCDCAPLHSESGFGLDARAQSDETCQGRLGKYDIASNRTRYPGVSGRFRRGSASEPGDGFQAAVVAAEYYRENMYQALKTFNHGIQDAEKTPKVQEILDLFHGYEKNKERAPIELPRMSVNTIAYGAVAYNAGPGSALAAKALRGGKGYWFDPSDQDPRADFPGGTSTTRDGRGTVQAFKGRNNNKIRWDVLLPCVQAWASRANDFRASV